MDAGDTARLIWAHYPHDPDNLEYLPYHAANRGTRFHALMSLNFVTSGHLFQNRSVFLKQGIMKKQEASEDARIVDVTVANAVLPIDDDTLYYCQIIQLPKHKTKQQITGVRNHIHLVPSVMKYGDLEKFLQAISGYSHTS